MTQPVYTTVISEKIRDEYRHYQRLKSRGATQIEINRAFCDFSKACEREGKIPLVVIDKLLNEL
jgi:hypothetical protein